MNAGKGYVSVRASSAHSILLSHNLTESGVYYLCDVTEVEGGEMKAVDRSVTTQVINVTGLLPDTTYRVDCVAYNSTGVEVCLEANTTVTTCELHSDNMYILHTHALVAEETNSTYACIQTHTYIDTYTDTCISSKTQLVIQFQVKCKM